MSYCVIEDVSNANPIRTVYNVLSKPSAAAVEGFIVQIAGEIDARLAAAGLIVPVTAPASFLDYLKRVNVIGAAYMAETAQFPENATNPDNPRFSPQGDRYYKQYREMLADLSSRKAIPPEVLMSATALARSYLTDNPDNFASRDGSTAGQQPMFGSGRSHLKEF